METKKCCSCKEIKSKSEFGTYKKNSDGLRYDCKSCKNKKSREFRAKNKKPVKTTKTFDYSEFNCDCCVLLVQGNISPIKKYCSEYCSRKDWANKNENHIKERQKKYVLKNLEKVKETKRNWGLRNPDKIKENSKKQSQKLEVRIKNALRSRVKEALKNNQKRGSTLDMIGCSVDELKSHIESLFTEGMSWDNWGFRGWHIDHIKPLSKAKDIDEMYELCHYTNLQPLWWLDNLTKSNK